MTRDGSEDIVSARAPEPVGAFPHAKRVGNLLFLSGIGPRVRGSATIPGVSFGERGEVVSYDIEAQCLSVFRFRIGFYRIVWKHHRSGLHKESGTNFRKW